MLSRVSTSSSIRAMSRSLLSRPQGSVVLFRSFNTDGYGGQDGYRPRSNNGGQDGGFRPRRPFNDGQSSGGYGSGGGGYGSGGYGGQDGGSFRPREPRAPKAPPAPRQPFTPGTKENGSVKWFNQAKGFGFITRPSGDDIFVHFNNITGTGFRSLQDGQKVEYVIADSEKGPIATEVVPLA